MQIRCSFTSVILAGRYDRKTVLTQRHKNAQKKHTRPHGRMPLGRVVRKGYSSRYLAAHNCTTSGFRAAFQFQGILGSTSYATAKMRTLLFTRNIRQKKKNIYPHFLVSVTSDVRVT